ncbi:LpqN/LpqT family lipoprotein [Mycolicibacterium boenickei]|nr:LpqN/LpqT family lipoprotein [Mycolicibacterium boenickei]
MTGPHKAINDYITENKIAETPFKPNDPGPPDFDFPFPPDRSSAGARRGAIVYGEPADPADPPAIIAIARRTARATVWAVRATSLVCPGVWSCVSALCRTGRFRSGFGVADDLSARRARTAFRTQGHLAVAVIAAGLGTST